MNTTPPVHDELVRAKQLLRQGRVAPARALLTELTGRAPQEPQAWYLLGCALGALGEFAAAGQCCRRCLELVPDHLDARLNLGNVLHCQGEHALALSQYEAVLERAPDHAGVRNNLGQALAAVGRLDEAERCFRTAIELDVAFAEPRYNLAQLLVVRRRYGDAVMTYRDALKTAPHHSRVRDIKRQAALLTEGAPGDGVIELLTALCQAHPQDAEAWACLGAAWGRLGRMNDAEDSLRRALAIDAGNIDARVNLGNTLFHLDRPDEALAEFQAAVGLDQRHARAYNNAAHVLTALGRGSEAEAYYAAALRIDPTLAEARYNLANLRKARGDVDGAVADLHEAIRLNPDFASAHTNLGAILYDRRELAGAERAFRRAAELDPANPRVHHNLGVVLRAKVDLTGAAAALERALALDPAYADAYVTLGSVRNVQGLPGETMALCDKALQLAPERSAVASTRLMSMYYLSEFDADDLLAAAVAWGRRYVVGRDRWLGHANAPEPGRRLRVGYVSGDLYNHPVAHFLEPMLLQRDREKFEVFCYYNNGMEDEQTRLLRGASDGWREVAEMTDRDLALLIARDEIDILVDLSGHTARNRLMAFAYKPAPVQMTWAGYFGTTGLHAMDYIVGDRFVAPAGHDHYYVERVMRLPQCYFCFPEPRFTAAVSAAPPAESAGHITFGAFHNTPKLGPAVVACWARILRALPGARLFFKYKWFDDAALCDRYRDLFAQHGVAPERLRFSGFSPRDEMLLAYRDVDIALDPYPYNGGATTFEALWMGVPVISLSGTHFVGRIGVGLLTCAGLDELVAADEDNYVATAVALAADMDRLRRLRSGLRERVLASPLFDGRSFAADLESCYRSAWTEWCRDGGRSLRP